MMPKQEENKKAMRAEDWAQECVERFDHLSDDDSVEKYSDDTFIRLYKTLYYAADTYRFFMRFRGSSRLGCSVIEENDALIAFRDALHVTAEDIGRFNFWDAEDLKLALEAVDSAEDELLNESFEKEYGDGTGPFITGREIIEEARGL